jgi:CBS domain-containing protein
MSQCVISVQRPDTIHKAAALMHVHDIGSLPVIDGRNPVGMLTDRDLVLRVLCSDPQTCALTVGEIMSPRLITCDAHQSVTEAAAIMGDAQIRQLLVVDDAGEPVGMLSLGDIAEHVSEKLAGQALGEIVEARRKRSNVVR